MTKDEALPVAWHMIAAEFVSAARHGDDKAKSEWLHVLDRMERTWPWLKKKRLEVPRLADIPDNFPDEAT